MFRLCTEALPLICVLPANESRAKGRRADANRFPAYYELWFTRCRGLHEGATLPFLGRFHFSGLLSVAPYCAPGGIRVVSTGSPVIPRAGRLTRLMVGRIAYQTRAA